MRHFTKVPLPCHEARTSEVRMCRLRGSKVPPSMGGCRGFLREQPPHAQPCDNLDDLKKVAKPLVIGVLTT